MAESEMSWCLLHEAPASENTTLDSFLSAAAVWIRRPHVVNRRLATCRVLVENSGEIDALQQAICAPDSGDLQTLAAVVGTDEERRHGVQCFVRLLSPKPVGHSDPCSEKELVVMEEDSGVVEFVPVAENGSLSLDGRYRFCFLEAERGNTRIQLEVSPKRMPGGGWPSDGVTSPHTSWLQSCLLPKIVSWSSAAKASAGTVSGYPDHPPLVDMERYSAVYEQLKSTRGKAMVKVWPERTDPHKFVYEDVAIASYLLVLWEEERRRLGTDKKQSFVDLGCGNGLLVHLLAAEGHPGKGIDVRRRRIWDLYGPGTTLEETAIEPSDAALFPDVDWIIGNHSDELTPWIPLIAARSSFATRYFVLPCCFFDFTGKFVRPHHDRSQYRCYLDYIKHIGEQCGFKVDEDVMRIPSTKRVCQVGQARCYRPEQETEREKLRQDLLLSWRKQNSQKSQPISETQTSGELSESSQTGSTSQEAGSRDAFCVGAATHGGADQPSDSAMWVDSFSARLPTEAVRNGTRIHRDVQHHIVHTVAMALLDRGVKDGSAWNSGGEMAISEAAELFDKLFLKSLRQECGGLQTALKNWSQVFAVVGGKVKLRNWSEAGDQPGAAKRRRQASPGKPRREQLIKTKLCWFHDNHPQGCPLTAEDCLYAHGAGDLREGPPPPSHRLSV